MFRDEPCIFSVCFRGVSSQHARKTNSLRNADGVAVNMIIDNWSAKAKRRRTDGTGRMRHLKGVSRRFKNGFREGTVPPKKKFNV